MKPQPNSVFETEVCHRCGGTGNYSYNQVDGTVCYGCSGTGWQYTKRGFAARKWWKETFSNKVKASEVTIGQRIKSGSMKFTVTEITDKEGGYYVDGVLTPMLTFYNKTREFGLSAAPNTEIDLIPSEEARIASLQAAKEYQATLNTKGKKV